MKMKDEIKELVDKQIISSEVAERINAYYRSKEDQAPNRLFIIFGVLGALLVGLGIILIVAHNWDEMPRTMKALLSFVPMLLGQAICVYTYFRKMESATWRESAPTFLFFAVGACIALISQIYNLGGDLSSFLLTWMLLCLPLVYIFNSSVVSLLYIIGISQYASELGSWNHSSNEVNLYWPLLFAVLYHYFTLIKNSPNSNFTRFHHWFIPLSVLVTIQSYISFSESSIIFVYITTLGLFLALSNWELLRLSESKFNSYKIIGIIGTVGFLLALSFDWYWDGLRSHHLSNKTFVNPIHFIFVLIFTILALIVLANNQRKKPLKELKFYSIIFLTFIPIYFIGLWHPIAKILINLLTFILGLTFIYDGVEKQNLAKLNGGLLTIMLLITCRFFDTDISFVIRGILFLILGIGFFLVNYWMLKKKKNEQ